MKLKERNSWKDVKLEEYYEMLEIFNSEISDIDKEIVLLSILGDIPIEEIDNMTYIDLQEGLKQYPFITSTPQNQYVENYYNIGDRKFKLTKNPSQLTVAQFSDMDAMIKNNSDRQLHIVAAILFVPVDENNKPLKYGEYDITEIVDYMCANLTVDIASSLLVFFCRYTNNLASCLMAKLEKETQKEFKNEKKKGTKRNMEKMMKMANFLKSMESFH